ncbi:MAG: hypothetical protein WBB82_00050 [Limnothrix sp.]
MLQTFSSKITALAIALSTTFFSSAPILQAQQISSSIDGKYENLVQVLECPEDKSSYGSFNEYGYWDGGAWCGDYGQAGYWVYNYPNWYIWGNEASNDQDIPIAASADGRYTGLLQVLNCPADVDAYGTFNSYGYWGGGDWCGDYGQAGYWVYSYPNWYVWSSSN